MKIYVVNYKETTLGEDNVMNVDSGVFDYGYLDEDKAIKDVEEMTKEKMTECVEELGYEEDDVDSTMNENGDYQCVTCGSNTYEYFVTIVEVE